jgi:hypothetical protein
MSEGDDAHDKDWRNAMHIVRPVFTGMALAIAGIMTFSMADTALAKTKKQTSTEQSQPQVQSSEVRSGADRQLQGRFYKRHKTQKEKTEKTEKTGDK